MTDREFLGRPEALGEELKRRRIEAGVEIDDIVTETKVSRRVFEAFETGRYALLPEKVFCKNFLRQYAALIGEEPEAIVGAFDLAWERFQLASGTFEALTVEEPPSRISRWWVWLPFVLAFCVILLLIFLSVRGSRAASPLPPDPRRAVVERPVQNTSKSVPTPFFVETSLPDESASSTANTQVEAKIRVAEGKECWIHYRDRDGVTGQDLLGGGQSTTLDLPGPVLLTVGNADAVIIEIRGREFRDLGKAGQVARFTLRRGALTPLGGGTDGG